MADEILTRCLYCGDEPAHLQVSARLPCRRMAHRRVQRSVVRIFKHHPAAAISAIVVLALLSGCSAPPTHGVDGIVTVPTSSTQTTPLGDFPSMVPVDPASGAQTVSFGNLTLSLPAGWSRSSPEGSTYEIWSSGDDGASKATFSASQGGISEFTKTWDRNDGSAQFAFTTPGSDLSIGASIRSTQEGDYDNDVTALHVADSSETYWVQISQPHDDGSADLVQEIASSLSLL